MKYAISPLTAFFQILSCMGPYIYDVHTEGGEWVRGWGLEIWHLFTNWQIYCSFLQMGSGLGIKKMFLYFVNVITVWQLILKVTSIKRNVFSFSLLRFKPNILHANWRLNFFFREYFKELHQHSIYCVLWKNVEWSSQRH